MGLFGSIVEGTIQNLGVENVQIRSNISIGGIAGAAGGTGYAVKEWLYIDGFWYLFGEDGRMVNGWT